MATSKRGGSRRGNKPRKTSNPRGRNQQDSRWLDGAKDNPLAAAIGAAAAVGAGVFLWSRRNQISDQISNLAEQVSEARETRGWAKDTRPDETAGGSSNARGARSQAEIAEEALTLKELGAASEAGPPPA